MAAEFEAQAASNSKRIVEAEAALEARQAILPIEKVEAYKYAQALKAMTTLIS